MAVNSATSTTEAPPVAEKPRVAGSNKLGKDEFMKLLLEQLKYQDPTEPIDSQAFVAQLAQFSTLEMMQNQTKTLEAILMGQAASQQTQVIGLIGKEVVFSTDKVTLVDGQDATVLANLSEPAENMTAVVKDANGRTVRTMQLAARPSGLNEIAWDGRDDAGNRLPAGSYTVSVTASDSEGNNIEVEQRSRSRVDGVSYEGGVPQLIVGDVKIGLPEVVEIKERKQQP